MTKKTKNKERMPENKTKINKCMTARKIITKQDKEIKERMIESKTKK